jgi:multidrug resistance efflux pump
MDSLPPIPTPASQRWREFRIQALPLVTFIIVLAGVVSLWRNYVLPTNVIGEVETTRANIISAVPGTIKELKVTRFQRVKAGEEIAVISTMDPESLQAALHTIEADLKLMRARMELDILRNTQGYEAARLEYLKERVELNIQRVNLRYQQSEADRMHNLFTNNLVNKTEYEVALSLAAATATNIIEGEIYLKQREETLPRLVSTSQLADEVVLASIKAQEEQLRSEGQVVSLKSPIDGMVSLVSFLQGKKVVANSPIVTISAVQGTRIVGYVRKPYSEIPKAGDTVQIRRQAFKREVANSTVLDVSGQLEPISLTLVPPASGSKIADLGLPFVVAIPSDLILIPGEPVDLIFKRQRR